MQMNYQCFKVHCFLEIEMQIVGNDFYRLNTFFNFFFNPEIIIYFQGFVSEDLRNL